MTLDTKIFISKNREKSPEWNAKALGIDIQLIRSHMLRAKYILPKKPIWTDRQLNMLRDLYPIITVKALSGLIGKGVVSINSKAGSLGLNKSTEIPDFLKKSIEEYYEGH